MFCYVLLEIINLRSQRGEYRNVLVSLRSFFMVEIRPRKEDNSPKMCYILKKWPYIEGEWIWIHIVQRKKYLVGRKT